jgi:hypothetical protein
MGIINPIILSFREAYGIVGVGRGVSISAFSLLR